MEILESMAGILDITRCCSNTLLITTRLLWSGHGKVVNEGWLLCERGVGSWEWGFLILILKKYDNDGDGDLLPWIMKL